MMASVLTSLWRKAGRGQRGTPADGTIPQVRWDLPRDRVEAPGVEVELAGNTAYDLVITGQPGDAKYPVELARKARARRRIVPHRTRLWSDR
jgi:hypothetical protein